MSQKKIRKAVFPVAGLGTRFLPATKSVPKEMMNVVDRPVLQWVVDEAREAGIETLIFVTGRGKQVIEDHFDMAYELEDTLQRRGKTKELGEIMKDLPKAGTAIFTRQQAPLGLGHAVWCAREIVGDEPFAVMLPDMLSKGCMKQMVAAYNGHGGNVIALEQVPMDQTHQYGVVAVGKAMGRVHELTGMVEKPAKGTAPSNYIISGRYILQPEVFDILEKGEKGAGGEIQLTDAMIKLMGQQKFFGMHYDGRTYDTGSKIGFLAANVAYGLERPELRDEFLAEIKRLVG
jgi:UTP--glucose-1-phosphate uridylyltransferase